MAAVASLLLVLAVSILVTKVATVALVHTGLSRESARFQARSAFTGVGFTTGEAESVVAHPVRRRIVMLLMILGNAGIVTVVTSLVLSFVGAQSLGTVMRLAIIVGGTAILFVAASSSIVDRGIARAVSWALRRWTDIDTRDYANLLHLAGDYRVQELLVEDGDWLADKTLEELRLPDEGVLVLGITRPDRRFVGAPTRETSVKEGDVIIVYGRAAALEELDDRRAGYEGDVEHREAVEEHRGVLEEQAKAEEQVEAEGAPDGEGGPDDGSGVDGGRGRDDARPPGGAA